MAGMRPIVEIMTVNFSLLALDQILNNAATLLHMSGGQCNVPLVIRMTTGAGRQVAAQHSHSLEGWYAHIPGIKVLAPATLEDARGMLWTALQDPDPVLIFEHGSLYNMQGTLAADAGAVDIRSASGPPGREATSASSPTAARSPKTLAAAEQLEARGHRRRGHRPALAAPAGRRDDHGLGGQDAPGRDRGRRLAHRQPVRRGQRADHGAGVLRARRSGRAGLHGRGADALPAAPGGGGAAAAGRRSRLRRARWWADVAEFRMPALGADMDEGTVLEWLVKPGDEVHKGDVIAVIDTAKSAIDVESFVTGTVETARHRCRPDRPCRHRPGHDRRVRSAAGTGR